jgi:hypothetical protein
MGTTSGNTVTVTYKGYTIYQLASNQFWFNGYDFVSLAAAESYIDALVSSGATPQPSGVNISLAVGAVAVLLIIAGALALG